MNNVHDIKVNREFCDYADIDFLTKILNIIARFSCQILFETKKKFVWESM